MVSIFGGGRHSGRGFLNQVERDIRRIEMEEKIAKEKARKKEQRIREIVREELNKR